MAQERESEETSMLEARGEDGETQFLKEDMGRE